MSKSELRNFFAEKFKGDERICIPPERYAGMRPEVTLVDALTRLNYIRKPDFLSAAAGMPTSVTEDAAYMMSLIEDSFDFYFGRGSSVLVWIVDKSLYVPITKGVEQRRRVDDANSDLQDLDSSDEHTRLDAEARLKNMSRIWVGMPKQAQTQAKRLRKKLDDRETAMQKITETKSRLTILELDNPRVCWTRLPMHKRRQFLSTAQDLGIKTYWMRDDKIVENPPVNQLDEECILDDYQLEAVLTAAVRTQSLPEPWDAMIRSNIHTHGARPKIMRYIIRSLLHGFYDAYTPIVGQRLFIDGHDCPAWRMAQQGVFTMGDLNNGAKATVKTRKMGDDGVETTTTKTRDITGKYANHSPIELSHPDDPVSFHRQTTVVDSGSNATYVEQRPTTSIPSFLSQSQRGAIPNCNQPRWRYNQDYQHKMGEGDFAIFHWIDKLRVRDVNSAEYKKSPTAPRFKHFEIVSIDTDVLYLSLIYLHKLKKAGEELPRLVIIMEAGWFANKKHIYDVNQMYDGIVMELLGGAEEYMLDFIYSFYGSAGDYIIGYKYVSPKTFIKAYLENIDYIGRLYKPVRTVLKTPGAHTIDLDVLDGGAYRRLLAAAYYTSYSTTLSKHAKIDNIDDLRGLGHLRRKLNAIIIKKEYRKYFVNEDPTLKISHIPEYSGDLDTDEERTKKSKMDKLFDLMFVNIQKKLPSDDEIMKRGLLLQNYMTMCSQVGLDELDLCDPLGFGYQPIDPDLPLGRSNIEFCASAWYELEEFFVNLFAHDE